MPGGDLLFHRLSDSTIGAEGFHGRVRDGIGWDTDAMATRQWCLRYAFWVKIDACTGLLLPALFLSSTRVKRGAERLS